MWASSKLRRRIGYSTWRRMHDATFGISILVLAHALVTGEDAGASEGIAMAAGSGTPSWAASR